MKEVYSIYWIINLEMFKKKAIALDNKEIILTFIGNISNIRSTSQRPYRLEA